MKDPNSPSSTKAKRTRRSIRERVGDSARAVGQFGDDLVHRPGVLPGKAHGWFRTWFGKVWKVRGGGLYAVGYALTFAYLEVRAIISELAEADGVVDFFTNQLFEFFFRFLSETMLNIVQAFIWPAHVVQIAQPYGAIALGIAFVLFPYTLKKPIERWLFGATLNDSDSGQDGDAASE